MSIVMMNKYQHSRKSLLLAERYSQFITSSRVTPRGGRRHTAGQCHVIPTDAHVHCSAMSSLWWIHTTLGQSCTHCLNEGIRVKFDCTIMEFRDYFGSLSSVNPPHRLHKPIQRRLDMTQYYIIITCIFDESAILRPYRMYGIEKLYHSKSKR